MNHPAAIRETNLDAEQADAPRGLPALVAATQRYIAEANGDTERTLRRLIEDFSYIHLHDISNPIKFLRQMEGEPPIRLGTYGFRSEIVDDPNPARHYMAFVAIGYWLPKWLAVAALYLWETAGFVRYGFKWSEEDMANGLTGVRHGNVVRQQGIEVLPALMAKDLSPDVPPYVPASTGEGTIS